jgi:hypothetical protein
MKSLSVLACALLLCGSASAEKAGSGNGLLPGCQNLLTTPRQLVVGTDACLGMVMTLMDVHTALVPQHRFCPPIGATVGQAIRIVVVSMEKFPDILHYPAAALAMAALKEAWPCRAPNQ